MSNVYDQMQQLLRCVRRGNENFYLFQARFNAHLHKFSALGSSTALSESFKALFFLNNTNVDSAQRSSILAASIPTDTSLALHSSTKEFIEAMGYEAVASVVCLCTAPTSSAAHAFFTEPSQTHAMTAYQPRHDRQRQSCCEKGPPCQQSNCGRGAPNR